MPKLTEIPVFFQDYPKTWAYRLTPEVVRDALYSRPNRPRERQRYWKQVEELKFNLDSYDSFATNGNVDDLVESQESLNRFIINTQERIATEDTESRKAHTIKFDQMYLENPAEGSNEFQLRYTTGTIEQVLRDKSGDDQYFVLHPEKHTVQSITISFVLDGGFKVTGVKRRDNAPYPYRQDYHKKEIYIKNLTPEDKSQEPGYLATRCPIRFDSLDQAVGLAQESTLPISSTNLDRKEGSVYLVNRALLLKLDKCRHYREICWNREISLNHL